MSERTRIVIFSHGMGVLKDSRGLFTELSTYLGEHSIRTVLFDYNDSDTTTNEVVVKPFSEQTSLLQAVIDKTNKEHPGSIIDIVAHSQGAIMVAQATLTNVRKTILLAPFFHTKIEDVITRHGKSSVGAVDFSKTTRRKRSDGTITVIPPTYWEERFSIPVQSLYNRLALKTDLTIINASEDDIMSITNLETIFNTNIINIHADHDFNGQIRTSLKKLLLKILLSD